MHYVDPVIKNFLRTNQPEDRGSYIRLDQNENPDGLPKWLFDEAVKKDYPLISFFVSRRNKIYYKIRKTP